MAKQLNVNLSFNSNADQLKNQLASLQKSLSDIAKLPGKNGGLFDDSSLQEASKAALELKQHLEAATDVNTGKLDLSRFSTSLQASNKDLKTYANQLLSVGDEGQVAFLKLAQSISTAEAPVTRINKKLADMGTTLKNTVRWQLSSSILHEFMGTVSSAYNYAQKLNKSLNDIRIVTGQSEEQMAKFAEQANRAAKNLSATTTAYTNAALIFYQQGLDDKAVQERTNTVIKLSNVTGDSAEDVSSYMTAIWENFDDGSKSLEYYADVITRLGADTAASSAEIAEGLESFASIGQTIGLSYEYATSALTTIVAKTRASASEVGNGLRTIFSRLQNLSLGKTLEDGTDLTKYSKALATVGVNIKDASGELKKMDDILDDLASKWGTLDQAEKVALANTVGGVRQYTKLISLMDNWDFMKQNIASATGSEGSLQEQADIYAESWESAQKKVKAAAQAIYADLLDDKFFIAVSNGFAKMLEGVQGLVEGFGGFKGVITLIGSLFLNYYAQKMPQALENLKQNFLVFTGQAKKAMLELQNDNLKKLNEIQQDPNTSLSFKTQAEGIAQVTLMQQKLVLNSKNLSDQEKMAYQARIQNVQAIYEEATALAKEATALDEATKASQKKIANEAQSNTVNIFTNYNNLTDQQNSLQQKEKEAWARGEAATSDEDTQKAISDAEAYAAALKEVSVNIALADQEIENLKKAYNFTNETDIIEQLTNSSGTSVQALRQIKAAIDQITNKYKTLVTQLTNLDSLANGMSSQTAQWKKTAQEIDKTGKNVNGLKEKIKTYLEVIKQIAAENGFEIQEQDLKELDNALNQNGQTATGMVTAFENFSNKLIGTSDEASSLSGKINILNNEMDTTRQTMESMKFDPSSIQELTTNASNAANAHDRLNIALQNGKGAAAGMEQGSFKMSTALSQFGSAMMNAHMILTSFQNAVNVCGDESSTTLEKIGAFISILTSGLSAFSAAQTLATTLSKADIVAKAGQAVATGAATIAQKALNAAMLKSPVGAVIAGIAVLTVALFGLFKGIKAIIDYFGPDTTLQDNLKAANEEAENFSNALETAKKHASELESDFNNYDSVIEALGNCAKGTQSWYDQIDQVRSVVNDLLQKYPELAKYEMQYDPETGLYTFSKEAIDSVIEEQNKKTLALEGANFYGQTKKSKSEAAVNTSNTQEALGKANGDYFQTEIHAIRDVISQAEHLLRDDDVRSLAGLLKNGVSSEEINQELNNAILKNYAKDTLGLETKDMSAEEIYSAVQASMAQEGKTGTLFGLWDQEATDGSEEIKDWLDQTTFGVIEALKDYNIKIASAQKIVDNATSASKNAEDQENTANEQTRIYNKNMASQLLQGTNILNQIDNQDSFLNKAGEEYGRLVGSKISEVNDSFDKNYEQYVKDYLNSQGIDLSLVSNIQKADKDGNIFYDYNGKTVEEGLKKDTVADFQGVSQAVGEFSEYINNNFIKSLTNAKQAAGDYAAAQDGANEKTKQFVQSATESFITNGNLDKITYGQKQALENSGITAENIKQGNITATDLGITNDTAQSLGYENAKAYMDAFAVALENNSITFSDKIVNNLFGTIQDGISAEANVAIEKGMKSASLGPLGEKGGKAYLQGLNLALHDANPDQMAAGIKAFTEVDWSSYDAASTAASKLKALGIEIDTDSEAWKAYTESMRNAYGVQEDFTSMANNFSDIAGLMNSTAGTELSTDEYTKLLEAFPSLAQTLSQSVLQVDNDTVRLTTDLKSLGDMDLSSLYSRMNDLYDIQQAVKDNSGIMSTISEMSSSSASIDDLKNGLHSLMDDTDATNLLTTLGYTQNRLNELCNTENEEELTRLVEIINSFLNGNYDTSELQEQLAATAKNFKELQGMLDNNSISAEAFNKAWASMRNQLDEDIDADRVEEVTDQIMEMAEATDGLDDSLKDNQKEAKKVASALERYNSAVEDITKNYDNWKSALQEISDSDGTIIDPDLLEEIGNAMGDMLDIDASSLSTGFLTDTKNLNLMKEAANGSAEAYEELRAAAAQDILAHCKIENQEEFDTALANLNAKIDEMNLEDIEIGASLMGDKDFINACDDLIEKAGMTAQQATSYLSSMGINAEVEQKPVEQKDNHQYNSVKSDVEMVSYDGNDPATGLPIKYSFPNVTTSIIPVEGDTTSTTTATALKVTSANKSSGGDFKIKNSGSSAPKGNSGSNKGGGGSKKTQTKNSEKHIKKRNEEDRYHVIKNQIEDLTAQYEKISAAKDKAFGPEKLKLLDQEIAKQKELAKANQKYLNEVQHYKNLDRGIMLGYGAEFDENGTITNYDELLEKQLKAYNDAVDKFNQAYTDDEGAKDAFEAAKEAYDKFKDDLGKYEESQDLYKDQLQKIIDTKMAEKALQLEKTQAEVELKVNVSDDSIEYLEYALDNIENKAYDVANAFALLDKKTAAYFEKSKAYTEGLRGIFKNQGLTDEDFEKLIQGDTSTFDKISKMLSDGGANYSNNLNKIGEGFTQDDIEAVRDYVKELISTNEELQEVRQTVHDQLLTVWDEWNDKMDTAISKIEHLQNITSSYKNIIDIVGQKSLGLTDSFMSDLSQKTIDQANNKLQAEKARYDSLKKSRDEAFAKYENQKNSGILSEEEVKMWEDNLKQMDDDVQSAAENFQSAWEDALNAANEEFENSIQRIIDAYSDAAAGLMGSMSELQEAFDRGTDLSDQYLDDYEKIYQFSKLNRDIQESIDSTDSVKAKKELLALQSKINAYEESGVEISEYQMDYLRKEYELKKAQIDLEESQNAKSQVKMQRDNEGNYSYVYTANDDDVAKAEQNYEDKLHEMQVANADYIKELQGNMVQMEQDYQDKVQEIMTDTSLTAEERMVKLNEVNEYYDEKMKYYISEAQVWQDNSSRLYDQDWKNYSEMTGYKISAADQWIDKWKETQLAMLTGFSSLEEYQQNHDTNVANLLLSAGSAFSTWQTNIETAMNSAGTSIGTFGDDATETLKAISEASKETKDSVVDMAESAEEAINGVTEAITNWEDAYSKVLKETLAGNEQLINSFNELLRAWSGVSSLPDTTPESKKVSTQSAPTPKTSSFDTGGYTGSWGADGKFALLHEKELILNAEDTKNFLTAIDTVRQISDMIDLNALSSSGGLTSLFAAKASTSDRTLQQEVTIHAEFPNVEDKDQISAAFNDLVNLASQYANRK